MLRDTRPWLWMLVAAVHTISATLAGAFVGITLSAVGTLLTRETRELLATLVALAGLVIGFANLAGAALRPTQLDRETPQEWLHSSPLVWSLRNGAALGIGFSSRLGFWLWYAIPVFALLVASPLFGAALYGSYGLMRGGMVWFWLAGDPRTRPRRPTVLRLLGWNAFARRATACLMLLVSLWALVR